MHEPPYRMKNMMPGMIMLWYGSVASIPSGWHLCDGSMGTPDLRNKYVPGAGDDYVPGGLFGADSQTHNFTGDGHFHTLLALKEIMAGTDWNKVSDTKPAVGTTDSADNRPQSHALCYIMKL